MAGESFDAARALVDLMVDLGGLFYTKPCFLGKQVHVQLNILDVLTKREIGRVHLDLDKLALRLDCTFAYSNIESGFVVYEVGPRAREFEIGFGNILLDLPEYKASLDSCNLPLGAPHDPLRIPERVDLPRYLHVPNINAYRDPVDMIVRISEYIWAKKAALPLNFRREVEATLFIDYRPLVARAEALVLRAVEFHREGYAELPGFLGLTLDGNRAWNTDPEAQ